MPLAESPVLAHAAEFLLEWRGRWTLDALLVLRAYARIPAPTTGV